MQPSQALATGRETPGFGSCEKFQTDPHFKDYILFYEYFHGDNGRGCGASHQTGWTGLIANLISQLVPAAEATGADLAVPEQAKPKPVATPLVHA